MPFLKLNFRPGIVRDTTDYANEGGFADGDKIRFFSGFPQKLGGWIKETSETFVGTCRQLFNWITSFADNFLAVGTNVKVYIETGAVLYDITPVRNTFSTPDTDDCISTTLGSTTVVFTVLGHGCDTGAYVTISGVTGDPGGVPNAEINTEHEVTVVDPDTFTITVTTAATSTVANPPGAGGNTIDIACQINPGFASATLGYGWGSSPWSGSYGWGLSGPLPVSLIQRDWWFDNFDNDLVMNIRKGEIYYWERGSLINPATALSTRAVLLSSLVGASSVPNQAMQILISQNDKHLLAFGCQPFGGTSTDYDPLLIRWASQDEPYYWNPTGVTPDGRQSSAGFIRVSRGSEIVRAVPTRQEIVVFTDTHVYSFQFLGTTDIFGLQELADNISIMSPRSAVAANSVVYWMGKDKFYIYSGQVQTLPCTVRDYVFKDINLSQSDQVICGTNEGFSEIWWFYPSANSSWNDRYVIFNYLENVWYYGTMVRTAWLDTALRGRPVAVATLENESTGFIYAHETGVNDDTLPMQSYIQSADFDLSDGEKFMLTDRLIPDFKFEGSTAANPELTMTIRPKRFSGTSFENQPSDTQPVIEVPINQTYTGQVFLRARGRQVAFRVDSSELDVQWQLGSVRLSVREDGKR
jgi:hypothetical protein